MKKLLLSAVLLLSAFKMQAQLPNGSIAPDFTLTDINGTTHNLYNYLDQGYYVMIDFSATWCGPCWSFHQSNTLKTIWANHGPAGAPGVSSTTTDNVIVIFIEGDGQTTLADLQGSTSGTQGNWLAGVDYYVTNSTSPGALNSAYQMSGFPTVFTICPNRTIKRSYVGYSSTTMTATAMYNEALGCPAPASAPTDAALITAFGNTAGCSGSPINLVTRIQNNGTTPLTSATITASYGGNQVASFNWTGNLNTYGWQDVTVGSYTLPASGSITYAVTATNDNVTTNNSQTRSYTLGNTVVSMNNITIKITLDRYGSETDWQLRNSSGTIVSQNPNYTNASANGAYPQADINLTLPNDCYTFTITDSYGDGMCCAYGQGGYQILADGVLIPTMSGGNFNDGETKVFKVSNFSSINNDEIISNVMVYPNPVNTTAIVTFENLVALETTIEVTNLVGQVVVNEFLGNVVGSQYVEINASDLTAGVYLVNIKTGNTITTKRIVVAK